VFGLLVLRDLAVAFEERFRLYMVSFDTLHERIQTSESRYLSKLGMKNGESGSLSEGLEELGSESDFSLGGRVAILIATDIF
jgi:hypothetical protein